MKSVLTIILGVVIAWFIVSFFSAKKSTYLTLHPADFESSPMQENPALIGTGLASRPSVMDATPSSEARPVMMGAMNMSPISVSRPPMPPATMNPQMPAMPPAMSPQQQQMPPAMNPQMMPPAMNPQMMPPAMMNPQMMPPAMMNPQMMPPAMMNPQQQMR